MSKRPQPIPAQVDVITELPSKSGETRVRVRALAAKGHELDARPIGGFFVVRRYAGDEFYLTDWRQFSKAWMEFVDEPPQEWLDAMMINEEQVAELMAKQEAERTRNPAEELVLAMSRLMNQAGVKPAQFDYSSGLMKPADPL